MIPLCVGRNVTRPQGWGYQARLTRQTAYWQHWTWRGMLWILQLVLLDILHFSHKKKKKCFIHNLFNYSKVQLFVIPGASTVLLCFCDRFVISLISQFVLIYISMWTQLVHWTLTNGDFVTILVAFLCTEPFKSHSQNN